MWFLPLMKPSRKQAALNFACEYGNCFLPSELRRSTRHEQDRYSQPILRPLSFRQPHPIMKSSETCSTPSLRTFSITNWKSRGGDVSSITLTTETLFSIERFWRKICRRPLGDSCDKGSIIVEVDFTEELSEVDESESGLFSWIFNLIHLIAIETISLTSSDTKSAFK